MVELVRPELDELAELKKLKHVEELKQLEELEELEEIKELEELVWELDELVALGETSLHFRVYEIKEGVRTPPNESFQYFILKYVI